MGLVLAAMIGSVDVAPAHAQNGRNEHRGNGYGGHYEHRGNGGYRGHYRYEHGRRMYQPYYGYGGDVYVPPPVVYAPLPPPGISIFIPPIFIRP